MRSDPNIRVCCDNPNCSYCEGLNLTTAACGYEERYIDINLEGGGWVIINGKDYCCEDCAEACRSEWDDLVELVKEAADGLPTD